MMFAFGGHVQNLKTMASTSQRPNRLGRRGDRAFVSPARTHFSLYVLPLASHLVNIADFWLVLPPNYRLSKAASELKDAMPD